MGVGANTQTIAITFLWILVILWGLERSSVTSKVPSLLQRMWAISIFVVVLSISLSPAQRPTPQKSMKQKTQRKPKVTKLGGWVSSIRAQQPLAGLPLIQDRRMCMHCRHVNFHIPPLPLQMPSVVRPRAGWEQRDHSEAALQFTQAAFTRLSRKPWSWRRRLGGGKFKDEDPAASHSRGPGWHVASIRESCWVTSDKECAENTSTNGQCQHLFSLRLENYQNNSTGRYP